MLCEPPSLNTLLGRISQRRSVLLHRRHSHRHHLPDFVQRSLIALRADPRFPRVIEALLHDEQPLTYGVPMPRPLPFLIVAF